jgi:hypothetical protein
MYPIGHRVSPLKLFLALAVVYFFTSLGHFSHNAEFICEYPNLPAWFTRAKIYAACAAITSVGMLGIFLIRHRFITPGLMLVAVYAALGFDGLAHYSVAPMELHTFFANLNPFRSRCRRALACSHASFTCAAARLSQSAGRRCPSLNRTPAGGLAALGSQS